MNQLTAKQLIEILQEVEPDTPVYFFLAEGNAEDDQRTPVKEDHIDLSIEGIVDINIPSY